MFLDVVELKCCLSCIIFNECLEGLKFHNTKGDKTKKCFCFGLLWKEQQKSQVSSKFIMVVLPLVLGQSGLLPVQVEETHFHVDDAGIWLNSTSLLTRLNEELVGSACF